MAVWSGKLHISSVKLQMTSYGLYSEGFFRLSSTSDPGKFLNIQTLTLKENSLFKIYIKDVEWKRDGNFNEAFRKVREYCEPRCLNLHMNDAFPISDREGVLVVVNYSYDFFDPNLHSYERGIFIVVYR